MEQMLGTKATLPESGNNIVNPSAPRAKPDRTNTDTGKK
jgi:hypothetical protein